MGRKHYPFVKTILSMANGDWGREHADEKDAVKDLLKKDLSVSDAAALAIVRVMDRVLRELYASEPEQMKTAGENIPPADAATFPGIKIGDSLYTCDELEEGASRCLVVNCDDAGHFMVVDCEPTTWDNRVFCTWTMKNHGHFYRTAGEAVLKMAKSDAEYYGPFLRLAEAIISAAAKGDSLERFCGKNDLDDYRADDATPKKKRGPKP